MSKPETVTNIWGNEWRVRESRKTPHGFAVKFGIRPDAKRGMRALIATDPLVEFLLERPDSTIRELDLPVAPPTVQRMQYDWGSPNSGRGGNGGRIAPMSCGRSARRSSRGSTG